MLIRSLKDVWLIIVSASFISFAASVKTTAPLKFSIACNRDPGDPGSLACNSFRYVLELAIQYSPNSAESWSYTRADIDRSQGHESLRYVTCACKF